MSAMVFDLDDLCDEMDPWDDLQDAKKRCPGLKVTLFAIPDRCSRELLDRYGALDWVELGVHGYHHSPMECAVWGYDEAVSKLREVEEWWPGVKLFKAPTWQLNEEVYSALFDEGWIVADHAAFAWPSGQLPVRRYTYNLPGLEVEAIHGHTWNTCGNGPASWDLVDGEYLFVSEVAEKRVWGWKMEDVQLRENERHGTDYSKTIAGLRIKDLVEKEGAQSVADFGGYDGLAALQSEHRDKVTVVEGDPNAASIANGRGLKVVCAELTSLPIPDDAFDWGICSHVMEHIEDAQAAMSELRRVCRKGVMIVVPLQTQEEFDRMPEHVHRMEPEEWAEFLGLEDVDIMPSKEYVGVWRR